jgi:hypothetical protein
MRFRVRHVAPVAVAATLLLLSACSAGSDPAPSASVAGAGGTSADAAAITSAVDAMQAQQTVKMDVAFEFQGLTKSAADAIGRSGSETDLSGQAVVDTAADRAEITMTAPIIGEIEVIRDGSMVYLKAPSINSFVGTGKRWVKFDAQTAGDSGYLGSVGGQNDPTVIFQALRGVGSDVEVVGAETIDGVQTTHYRGTIDPQKAVEMVPSDQQKQVSESLGQLGAEAVPVDVWVDDQGLVRRVRYSLDFGALASISGPGADPSTAKLFEGVTMVMTMDLHDYGAPVHIRIPPAKQVNDLSTLPF